MIEVTRLDDSKLVINSDLIEFVEETPDTIISLTTGKKIMVRETANDIINRVTEYRKRIGIRINDPGTLIENSKGE